MNNAESTTRTIEINGVKFDIDLRHAVRVDRLRIGDRVKVLIKSYGDSYAVYHGVIVAFEPFAMLPTIVVAYMDLSYTSCELKFLSYNAKTEGTEVVAATDDDALAMDKGRILDTFDANIERAEREIEQIQERKRYFLKNFSRYWGEIEPMEVAQ